MHKLLHISSKDKHEGSNANFSLNLSHHYWLQSAKSIVVKNVTIPHVFYNVNSMNSSFTYEIAGTPSTVVLTSGNYTWSELLTDLNTAMVADGVVGFVGSRNETTHKFEFVSTTAIEYLYTGNAMATLLGITAGNGSDVTSFSAQALPAMQGIRNIVIASSALGENNYIASDNKIADVIAVIPVVEAFGGVIHYVSQHTEIDDYDTVSKKNGKNISQIDIRVIDADTNTVVDLTNHHIDILLKIYY